MPYAPRTVAFFCELRHPPLPVDLAQIQKVHNRMFTSGKPTYASFNVSPEGASLSNPALQPGVVSSATFTAEAFQFREEGTGLTVEEFAARVKDVCAMVAELRGLQLLIAQVITIRTLVNPRTYRDSRLFLKDGVFGFDAELADFRRVPQLYGMRLVFPPTQEEPNAFTLRIESFANDSRSIFLENQGTFGPLVVVQGFEPIGQAIQATYDFLAERALAFLEHFDARQEA